MGRGLTRKIDYMAAIDHHLAVLAVMHGVPHMEALPSLQALDIRDLKRLDDFLRSISESPRSKLLRGPL